MSASMIAMVFLVVKARECVCTYVHTFKHTYKSYLGCTYMQVANGDKYLCTVPPLTRYEVCGQNAIPLKPIALAQASQHPSLFMCCNKTEGRLENLTVD